MTVNSQSRSLITTDHSEEEGVAGGGHGWNVIIVGLFYFHNSESRVFSFILYAVRGNGAEMMKKSFALKIHCNVIEGGEK